MMRLLSRRGLLVLLAIVELTSLSMRSVEARGHHGHPHPPVGPNCIGFWQGAFEGDVFAASFSLNIQNQTNKNKKSDKIKGFLDIGGQSARVSFTLGKDGKAAGHLDGFLNDEPVTISMDMQVNAEGNHAEGTFAVTSSNGQPRDSGAIIMDKN